MLPRHDFARSERRAVGRTDALLPLLATASRLIANALTGWLGTPCECKAEGPSEATYRQLLTPSQSAGQDVLVVFTCADGSPEAMLQLPRDLLEGLIEKLMGGPMAVAVEGLRTLTDFDRAMAMKVAGKMLDGLEEALQHRLAIDGAMLRAETDLPRLPRTQAPNERYLSLPLRLEIKAEAPLAGVVRIVFPTSFLQPLLEVEAKPPLPDPTLSLARCEGMSVGLRAEFGHREVTLKQLLALRPGSTIGLDGRAAGTVLVRIEDAPTFVGRAARHGDHVVVEIARRFKEDDDDAELLARL